MPFTLKPGSPFRPESSTLHGPGVEFWSQREINNDERTDHVGLMADVDRRKRIAARLLGNIELAAKRLPKPKAGTP